MGVSGGEWGGGGPRPLLHHLGCLIRPLLTKTGTPTSIKSHIRHPRAVYDNKAASELRGIWLLVLRWAGRHFTSAVN